MCKSLTVRAHKLNSFGTPQLYAQPLKPGSLVLQCNHRLLAAETTRPSNGPLCDFDVNLLTRRQKCRLSDRSRMPSSPVFRSSLRLRPNINIGRPYAASKPQTQFPVLALCHFPRYIMLSAATCFVFLFQL